MKFAYCVDMVTDHLSGVRNFTFYALKVSATLLILGSITLAMDVPSDIPLLLSSDLSFNSDLPVYKTPLEYESAEVRFAWDALNRSQTLQNYMSQGYFRNYQFHLENHDTSLNIKNLKLRPTPIINTTSLLPTVEREFQFQTRYFGSMQAAQLAFDAYLQVDIHPNNLTTDPLQQFHHYGFRVFLKY